MDLPEDLHGGQNPKTQPQELKGTMTIYEVYRAFPDAPWIIHRAEAVEKTKRYDIVPAQGSALAFGRRRHIPKSEAKFSPMEAVALKISDLRDKIAGLHMEIEHKQKAIAELCALKETL